MKTPYEVLNMSEDDDFDSLKARYEELKAVYGEERFLPGDQGAEGAKKLTELEAAWREILDKKRAKDDEAKYGVGYGYVEQMVKEKKYDEAQARLDNINTRDGEWHYYQALVFYKREWMNDCYAHLKEAVRLCPDNEKYKESLTKMTQVLGNKNTPPAQLGGVDNGASQGNMAGNCLNTCCTAICCMECLSLFRCC
ncbi:MAG: hypothetical protein J1F36_02010 [Clostridiales bacterium]|nr:hypothetical protein [Clostridiales bacterium]